jgi:hypothetical protein
MARPKGAKNKLIDAKTAELITNPEEYDKSILRTYKQLSLRIANSITDTDIKKTAVGTRITALGILQDKINLKEGKSTENIAHRVLHSLDEESMKILRDFSKSLIKSMLNND